MDRILSHQNLKLRDLIVLQRGLSAGCRRNWDDWFSVDCTGLCMNNVLPAGTSQPLTSVYYVVTNPRHHRVIWSEPAPQYCHWRNTITTSISGSHGGNSKYVLFVPVLHREGSVRWACLTITWCRKWTVPLCLPGAHSHFLVNTGCYLFGHSVI